ncbi:lycopene cyclase domain-containing protein [Patescibacteria group bacterium]
MEYFLILIFFALLGFTLEKMHHIHLYHNRKERLIVVGIFFVIGVIWDTFAIWRGHWLFPDNKTIGIKIGLMPLEEYLFILVVPYTLITIYTVIHQKFDNPIEKTFRKLFKR